MGEKENDSGRTRTIRALIARREKKFAQQLFRRQGRALAFANLSPPCGADSHALIYSGPRIRKCINSS